MFLSFVVSFDLNGFQVVVPLILCSGHYTVEVPRWDFGFDIPLCSFYIYGRYTYFYKHFFVLCCRELEQCFFLFQFTGFSIAHDIDDRVDDMASEWFGKFHVKAYALIFRPASGLFPPDYFGIAERGELHIDVFLSL